MDRKRFYDTLRARNSGVFGTSLSTGQVSGIEAILDEGQKRGTKLPRLAYILATSYLETAHTMQPIFERGQRAYFNKYEPGTKIGKMLGNTVPGDGYRFRGRGLPQLTGRRNYAVASKKLGVDFVAYPDRVLEPRYAIPIMFDGMEEGWFTGRDLSDFIDDFDESDEEDLREFINARRIVNGTDKAEQIGRYALTFEMALRGAGYLGQAPAKPLVIPPAPPVTTPKPSLPKALEPETGIPASPSTPEKPWWVAVLESIGSLFRR